MALRKVGTSYSALRAATRLPPVERPPETAVETAAEGAPQPVETATAAPGTSVPDPVGEGAHTPQVLSAAEAGTRRPARKVRKAADPGPVPEAGRKPASTHFRLRVPYPARGTCAEFERIAEAYDTDVAIQTVFKRAFDAWVEGFDPARPGRLDTEYARGDETFATSRIIRTEIVEAVAGAIDPLGIRTKTYIAERIALAAMKAYMTAR